MRRARAAWFSVRRWLPSLVLVLVTSVALADDKIAFLAERLRTADDFRVRANAALALGNTNDDAAVPPLCVGIDDSSDIVRKAVALALGRLKRQPGVVCLRRRAGVEKDASVKLQIDRAIEQIQAGGSGGGGDGPVANAKYYVSLSAVSNASSRSQGDVDRIIQGAIKSKLSQIGGYEIAPAGESSAAAKAVLAKRGLKGFYLAITLEKFDYSDSGLRVKIHVAVSSYPGKDIQGDMSKGGSIPGAHAGDTSSEDQLMSAIASSAADSFAQAFH